MSLRKSRNENLKTSPVYEILSRPHRRRNGEVMNTKKVDVAIVGAGIVGLAHAYIAARSGRRVAVLERNPTANGASVRNFGMIWPIGQPAGTLHQMALRSRAIWVEALEQAQLPFFATGSLHVAYRDDEAAVGQEFNRQAAALGYDCAWLTPRETLERSRALRPEGLLGALWSATELTVDPRQITGSFPKFLAERYGVQFAFNTAVHSVDTSLVQTREQRWEADTIIVASGDDFQTLFPECFKERGLTRCKLQMMRTAPQPQGWALGPAVAFGLTFQHYPTFQVCASLDALKDRIARETPEFDQWGIHVMVSQNGSGELTIGDSHEYGLAVDIFDKPVINRLILDYARRYLVVPTLEITEYWHGVYAKHSEHAYLDFSPVKGVRVVTVTTGIGMTMSFGIAEQTLRETGVAA